MSNNKQIEKPLELPHQETIVGTNTIQTKPFDNQKTMSNNKQSSVEWLWLNLTDDLIGDLPPEKIHRIYELVQQAKAMEATSKQMSYGDGYSNGYDRALELVKWKINNELAINNK